LEMFFELMSHAANIAQQRGGTQEGRKSRCAGGLAMVP
jgi:hypothetical protein